MEIAERVVDQLRRRLALPIFTIGATQVSLWTLAYFLFLLGPLFYLTGKLRQRLVERLFARRGIDIGVRQATGSIIRYLLLFIGLLVIFQTLGVDLGVLTVLAGALGIGVGIGLQAIIAECPSAAARS